jgi:ubiquinone/menaquinone biosynthesis C-methylase UbiE
MYRLLDLDPVYRVSQFLLAPGARRQLRVALAGLLESRGPTERLLDVGAGPASWLWEVGRRPVGADLSARYVRRWITRGERGVQARAEHLPFRDRAFDAVCSIGLLHHLDDGHAVEAIREMLRVCRAGGLVAILDAVRPHSAWRRPVAAAIRVLDRGPHVRTEEELRRLLPPGYAFTIRRFSYSLFGLEMVACTQVMTS